MVLPPRDERFLEDYSVGAVFEFGDEPIDEAEVIAFAQRYDPQYIHIDPEAAADGPFGGLIASGWMTCGTMMRLMVEHYIPGAASLGSPGLDSLRFRAPVRPGDRLKVRAAVVQVRRSRSRPDRGVVHADIDVINQNGVRVLSHHSMIMVKARGPA